MSLFVNSLDESSELWEYYFNNLIFDTLHLDKTKGISNKMLRTFFTQLCKEKTVVAMVVHLHVHFRTTHRLVKKATIFRCLDFIDEMSTLFPHDLSHIISSSAEQLIDKIKQRKNPLGTPQALTQYVVRHLFVSLTGAVKCQSQPSQNKLLRWYDSYRYEYAW